MNASFRNSLPTLSLLRIDASGGVILKRTIAPYVGGVRAVSVFIFVTEDDFSDALKSVGLPPSNYPGYFLDTINLALSEYLIGGEAAHSDQKEWAGRVESAAASLIAALGDDCNAAATALSHKVPAFSFSTTLSTIEGLYAIRAQAAKMHGAEAVRRPNQDEIDVIGKLALAYEEMTGAKAFAKTDDEVTQETATPAIKFVAGLLHVFQRRMRGDFNGLPQAAQMPAVFAELEPRSSALRERTFTLAAIADRLKQRRTAINKARRERLGALLPYIEAARKRHRRKRVRNSGGDAD